MIVFNICEFFCKSPMIKFGNLFVIVSILVQVTFIPSLFCKHVYNVNDSYWFFGFRGGGVFLYFGGGEYNIFFRYASKVLFV